MEQCTHHTAASSVLPASKNASPRTLNNLPCDEATPIPLARFFPGAALERVDWRREGRVGPADEARFSVEDFRRLDTVERSSWLWMGGGDSLLCSRPSALGSCDGGRVEKRPEFRYSFPMGDSKFWICP